MDKQTGWLTHPQTLKYSYISSVTQLFKLLNKYRPESKAQKKERLRALAEKKVKSDESGSAHKKPVIVKYGIHHITSLVEQKKAQLVIIAHDVDPIEVSLCMC